MLKEFKEFAMRGAAFGKIVTSLVDQIIMPLIGMVTGGVDFSDMKWVLKPADVSNPAHKVAEVAVQYGAFINTLIQFIIIAFAIFLVVKAINKLTRREPAAPAAPAADVVLLTEIRDLLKNKP
jgi:large conductance mechanosensitive channel